MQALGRLESAGAGARPSGDTKIGDPVVAGGGGGRSFTAAIAAKQEFAGYWEYLLDDAIFTAPAHPSGAAPR